MITRSKSNMPFPFLSLPQELRDRVYKYHVRNHAANGCEIHIGTDKHSHGHVGTDWHGLVKILRVNKQICKEASEEIYNKCILYAHESTWMQLNNIRLAHPRMFVVAEIGPEHNSAAATAFADSITPSMKSGRFPSRRFSLINPRTGKDLDDVVFTRDARHEKMTRDLRAARGRNVEVHTYSVCAKFEDGRQAEIMKVTCEIAPGKSHGGRVVLGGPVAFVKQLWEGLSGRVVDPLELKSIIDRLVSG